MDREELDFWEAQTRCGEAVDLKLARDLPDDTPDYILKMMEDFEEEVSKFCFSGARGRVLDAGCGNGNLLLRTLGRDNAGVAGRPAMQMVGMDFSRNMLGRAAMRAADDHRAGFLRGSVTSLPFRDCSFDHVVSSGVLTCLPHTAAAIAALWEFYRILKPEGTLVVDFFNQASHYTLVRKHIFKETIKPPEYMRPAEFYRSLEEAGFAAVSCRGFDFKPCQGYLFLSRWRGMIDPGHIQERLSSFLERRIESGKGLNLLGYRIYVRCVRK
ncbi:MAG: methyltransferase domain family [Methanosaeta sp. NSM2]|nr:MAG: methyltransferase domain family [Methanosaeta sp. NSM2]